MGLLLSSYILFISMATIPTALSSCEPDSCHAFGPVIRFPFRLRDRQPYRCGYPGFELYCNANNQTILRLPLSGEFVVGHIDYATQALFISDPDSCLASRILNFTLAGSAFGGGPTVMMDYTYLNCSNDEYVDNPSFYVPLYCMSGRNHTVVATNAREQVPLGCRTIARVMVPMVRTMSQFYWSPLDMREHLELGWSRPSCWSCEAQGGACGFRGDSGQEIGCSRRSRSGLSRRAKYGITLGVGIPGLICIVGLACYACGMLRTYGLRRNLNTELPTTVFDQRPTIRSTSGLDLPTIESYPKMMLGESRRLPNPSDKTCPICLSDYQSKETLRSIPECNHYFHSDCIDEWLKLNGTCPLCRNSPDGSAATPCSSVLSSSSSSSTTTPPGQS